MDEKIVKDSQGLAKELVNDCISRKAAIDAIRASTSKYTGFMEMEMYTDDDAVEAIEALPSAELEIIRCKNCRNNHWCNIQEAAMAGDNFFCGAAERRTDEQ